MRYVLAMTSAACLVCYVRYPDLGFVTSFNLFMGITNAFIAIKPRD